MTHFHDFKRDDGRPVTVEYRVESHGEPNFDSPGHICDGGGSAPEIVIVDSWPNEPWYDDLARRHNARRWPQSRSVINGIAELLLRVRITWASWRYRLSVVEIERMEAWLAENYVEEPYEEEPR